MNDEIRQQAACRGVSPSVFVPPEGTRGLGPKLYAQARKYCAACPIVSECLEFALTEGLDYGMYGNTTPRERQKIAMKRKRVAVA